MAELMQRNEKELWKTPKGELLMFFGILQFHIESLQDHEDYAEKHPHAEYLYNEPERLTAYIAKKEEIRAILCHGAPRAPEL